MKNVNLIPTELSVGDSVTKIAKSFKSTSVVLAAIAIFAILVAFGGFFFFSQNLKDITTESENLKRGISDLEKSEQRLIFAKDRLAKIKEIQSEENAIDEVKAFDTMYKLVTSLGNISVSGVKIDSNTIEFSVVSTSLSSMTSFFEGINDQSDLFSKVALSSFGYVPSVGYSANLVFETTK